MRNEIVVHIDTLLAAREETKVSRQPDRPTLGNPHHSNFAGLSRLQKIPITGPSVWSQSIEGGRGCSAHLLDSDHQRSDSAHHLTKCTSLDVAFHF